MIYDYSQKTFNKIVQFASVFTSISFPFHKERKAIIAHTMKIKACTRICLSEALAFVNESVSNHSAFSSHYSEDPKLGESRYADWVKFSGLYETQSYYLQGAARANKSWVVMKPKLFEALMPKDSEQNKIPSRPRKAKIHLRQFF